MDKLQLIKALLAESIPTSEAGGEADFTIGEQVFIRAVPHYHVGRVVKVTKNFVWLEDAAWIADTGRFADALKKAEFNEVEPFKDITRVGIGAITDVTTWSGPLPLSQK